MKPDAVYIFQQCPKATTRYKQTDHRGADIPDFPAVWKKDCPGGKAGEKYLGYRVTVKHKAGHRIFVYTLELGKEKYKTEAGEEKTKTAILTGLNFAPEFPRRAWGDDNNPTMRGNNAILVEFSESRERLTIWFFRGMKETAQSLFQLWQAGELALTAAADTLPLETKKAGQ